LVIVSPEEPENWISTPSIFCSPVCFPCLAKDGDTNVKEKRITEINMTNFLLIKQYFIKRVLYHFRKYIIYRYILSKKQKAKAGVIRPSLNPHNFFMFLD
jgi:hypothetical protein